jgi:hypothetical protein
MPSGFPNSIDSFTNPLASSPLNSPSHAVQHQDLNDAVNKIETYMGLVFVKSQTVGTGVSSVSVTNAFSANYDNYKILISGGAGSSTSGITMILTGSTTGYYQGNTNCRYDTGAVAGTGTTNGAAFTIGRSNTDTIALSFELINPFLAKTTMITGSYNDTRGIAGATANLYTGFHSVQTSYTGFTFTFDTGTFTGGTIRVYGYRN